MATVIETALDGVAMRGLAPAPSRMSSTDISLSALSARTARMVIDAARNATLANDMMFPFLSTLTRSTKGTRNVIRV